jgi:hypothetical protein
MCGIYKEIAVIAQSPECVVFYKEMVVIALSPNDNYFFVNTTHSGDRAITTISL